MNYNTPQYRRSQSLTTINTNCKKQATTILSERTKWDCSAECALNIHTHTHTHTQYTHTPTHILSNTTCLPLSSLSLIIPHTHIFILTPTHVSTHKHKAHRPHSAISSLSLFCIVASYHCLSWHTHTHTRPCVIGSLSLCCTSTHFVVFVDRALSRDKVHADQLLSTLLDRVTYTKRV